MLSYIDRRQKPEKALRWSPSRIQALYLWSTLWLCVCASVWLDSSSEELSLQKVGHFCVSQIIDIKGSLWNIFAQANWMVISNSKTHYKFKPKCLQLLGKQSTRIQENVLKFHCDPFLYRSNLLFISQLTRGRLEICIFCQTNLFSAAKLRKHLMQRMCEEQFSCDICEFKGRTTIVIRKHKKAEHDA